MKKLWVTFCLLFSVSPYLEAQSKSNLAGFEGGDIALYSFLMREASYPVFTTDSVRTEVTVMVKFVVNRKGDIVEKSIINRMPETQLFEKNIYKALEKTDNMWLKGRRKRTILVPFIFQLLTPVKWATSPKYPFPYDEYMGALKSAKEPIIERGLLLPAVYIRVFRGRRME